MAEKNGYFTAPRDIWDDPDFRDAEFSQREAWLWMIAHASWKGVTVSFGSKQIDLEPGQLAYSTRYLAKAFGWSEPRVRRYFSLLKNRRRAQTKTDAGITVITICNYAEDFSLSANTDAEATQQPTQKRRIGDANKKQDNQDNQKKTLLPADAGRWQDDSEFVELWTLWKTTSEGAGRSKTPRKLHPIFCHHRKRAGYGPIITGARVYVASNDCKRSGGKALDRWLQDERYIALAEQARPRPVEPGNRGGTLADLGVAI